MRHRTLFISDLHLQRTEPHLFTLFENFIHQRHNLIDAIYILGDLFEFWIGDDDITPFHHNIMRLLSQARNDNIPIYIQHGNRDFLLGKQFCKATGCKLLPEETCINLYNTPILLLHGDLLCLEDKPYQKMRKFFHNRLLQKFFLHLPISWRRRIAEKIRTRSQQHISQSQSSIMDVTPSAVTTMLNKHQVNHLIHGHTHKPAIHKHENHTRIVLGAWHEKASILTWYEDGETTLSF